MFESYKDRLKCIRKEIVGIWQSKNLGVMTYNPKYNTNCSILGRNCVSGCCTDTGACSSLYSSCKYKYMDYKTNAAYYYPDAYNLNCGSNGMDCSTGCCTGSGSCAITYQACVYKYNDFSTNPTYHYPGALTPLYNISCGEYSHGCSSGCCMYDGFCATASSNCIYPYQDYYTNPTYSYRPIYGSNCQSSARSCVSGCCNINGTCAYYAKDCRYPYVDFVTNKDYYFPLKENVGTKFQVDIGFWVFFGLFLGFFIYLSFFIIAAMICDKKRLNHVKKVNAYHMPNQKDPNENNQNQTRLIAEPTQRANESFGNNNQSMQNFLTSRVNQEPPQLILDYQIVLIPDQFSK